MDVVHQHLENKSRGRMLGNMGFLGFGVYQKKLGVPITEHCPDWNHSVVSGYGKRV